jgi:hypothetical protein
MPESIDERVSGERPHSFKIMDCYCCKKINVKPASFVCFLINEYVQWTKQI